MAKMKICILLVFFLPLLVCGQVKNNAFNGARQQVGGNKKSVFNQNRVNNFNDYRQKLNAEYIRMTREKWRDFNPYEGLKQPDDDVQPVAPIHMSDDDAFRNKQDRIIKIDGVVKPLRNNGRPQPIAPVQETPENNPQYWTFNYLGSSLQVRKPQNGSFNLSGVSENAIADAWEQLCDPRFNNMLIDCIKLRASLKLCDWAYLMMLQALADNYCGKDTNKATLLMAFLYSQSGYRMRLGQSEGRLEMLYASLHDIYKTPYILLDGEKYYTMSDKADRVQVNAAKYPKEQSMSLWVPDYPQVSYTVSPIRTLTSKRFPDMSIQVTTNKSLLPFFNSYPASEVGGDFMTRWAMYANVPMWRETREELYVQLKRHLNGKSQLDAVERLLNWVQTAFVYEYDDKVWGRDRAFFPDESLYYPYCDCEDRSILFSRLIRDLLGLPCVLVYYPGHLATAVCFSEAVNGDYIIVNGKRFVVCDPTYIGASVGATMPNMDNSTAKVIIL